MACEKLPISGQTLLWRCVLFLAVVIAIAICGLAIHLQKKHRLSRHNLPATESILVSRSLGGGFVLLTSDLQPNGQGPILVAVLKDGGFLACR